MTKTVIRTIAGAIVVAVLVILNPAPQTHRERIQETVAERSPLAGAFGLGALAAFTSSYHSLGVASYTTVDGKALSIGALGVVYVREIE